MNKNRLICTIIGALLLATPASAQTPTPQFPEGPCPISTPPPTATPTAEATGVPTATPTATPKAEATATPTATPTAAPTRPPTQYRSVALILLDSPDPVTTDGADSMFTAEEATNFMWDYDTDEPLCNDFFSVPPYTSTWFVAFCGTRDLWLNATFGIIDFVRDSNFATYPGADVYGPYESAIDAHYDTGGSPPCDYEGWKVEGRAAVIADESAPDSGELAAFDHQVFVLPWQNPHYLSGSHYDLPNEANLPHNACGFGGYGYINGPVVWTNFPSSGTIAHELGHNLYLQHCSDKTDLMCGPGRITGFNGPSLISLEILQSHHVAEVSSNDTVVLLPMSVDPWDYPGKRVIKITVPSGDPYYIDFHDNTGVDEHARPQDELRAGINRWSGVEGESQEYIGRIGEFETYTDPRREFSIEVTDLSAGADSLEMTIEVTFYYTGVLAHNWNSVPTKNTLSGL